MINPSSQRMFMSFPQRQDVSDPGCGDGPTGTRNHAAWGQKTAEDRGFLVERFGVMWVYLVGAFPGT